MQDAYNRIKHKAHMDSNTKQLEKSAGMKLIKNVFTLHTTRGKQHYFTRWKMLLTKQDSERLRKRAFLAHMIANKARDYFNRWRHGAESVAQEELYELEGPVSAELRKLK